MTAHYEIRVRGHLSPKALALLQDLEPDSMTELQLTVLVGDFDQSQLHGLLERLRYLGLDLDDMRRVPPLSGP